MQCIIWLHAEETFISFNKLWTLCDLFLSDNVDRLLWRVMCQFEVPIKLFYRRQAAIYKEKRGSESWTISPPDKIILCITRPLLNVFRLEVDGGRVEEWEGEGAWMNVLKVSPACLPGKASPPLSLTLLPTFQLLKEIRDKYGKRWM